MKRDPAQTRHLDYETRENRFFSYEMAWKRTVIKAVEELYGSDRSLKILDFGSGRGEFLQMLSEEAYDNVIGVDADPTCVQLSRRYGETIHVRSAEDALRTFGEGSFDLVTALHVLEHLEDVVSEVCSLSKLATGHLIFAVPNLCAPHRLRLARRMGWVNPGHICGWDFPHFQNLLEGICGLIILKYVPDVVVVPKMSGLLYRLGIGYFFEYRMLPRMFPYLSNSIIAICKKP